MRKNARLTPRGRAVPVQRLCHGQRPAEVAQAMGISETTVRKWRRRHLGIGWEYVHVAIDDHSRTTLVTVAEDKRQEGVAARESKPMLCRMRANRRSPRSGSRKGSLRA